MPRKVTLTLGTLRVTYRNGEVLTFSLGLVNGADVTAANARLQGRNIPGQRGQTRSTAGEIKLPYYRLRENLSGITPLGAITLNPAEVASLSIVKPVQVEVTG